MIRPYRDTLTGETVMMEDHDANEDRMRFKRLHPDEDVPPISNPEAEIAQAIEEQPAIPGDFDTPPLGDFPPTPGSQEAHAASLSDNPPYPLPLEQYQHTGAPDTRPPEWPNAS